MQAFGIIVGIFAMLSAAAMAVVALMNVTKKRQANAHIIVAAACGLLVLAWLFMVISYGARSAGVAIVALIFMLLGWLALAAGFVVLNLEAWGSISLEVKAEVAAEPAPPQAAGPEQPSVP
jgi:bacteriorhodopsin